METIAERIWLRNYPAGVPAEIDPEAYASLKDLLEASCRLYAEKPAYTNLGTTLSYAEFDRVSRDFAAYLQRAGLQKGERIALMMPNLLQYPVTLFGAFRAGLTVVNTNPLYTARELHHQLDDSGASAIVVLENFAHTLQEVADKTALKLVVTTRIGDLLDPPFSFITNFVVKYVKRMVPPWQLQHAVGLPEVLRAGARLPLADVSLSGEDIAFLQYTGGTTGVPKGAMLTHRNMVSNLQQTHAWIGRVLQEGRETVVTPLPLYHIFSLTANLLTFAKIGARNVLITNPRDIEGFIKELRRHRFTAITGVNTLFNALLNSPRFKEVDLKPLKVAVGGGAAVQRAVAERWKALSGVPLIEGYGLTETSPVACANPLDIKDYTGTIGMPLPSTEVSIRDDAGAEVPLGATGEICIRGPQVMKGYWNRPDETAKAFIADGWLRTGDMGFMDERGYVKVVDRKKDVILVSGFNVFPNEVEDVAALHPGVLESAAIGVPDERSGEAVKLFVVRRDPDLTAEAVIEHCRKNLSAYKVPRYVEFRTELPKTPIGKVLRRSLR